MVAKYLQRSQIVAPAGWRRWLVPPAALSIHLAIGQAYAWSVFKSHWRRHWVSGVASALPFTLGIVMLGLSAALFGTSVDRHGPRWAMFISMCCFCGAQRRLRGVHVDGVAADPGTGGSLAPGGRLLYSRRAG